MTERFTDRARARWAELHPEQGNGQTGTHTAPGGDTEDVGDDDPVWDRGADPDYDEHVETWARNAIDDLVSEIQNSTWGSRNTDLNNKALRVYRLALLLGMRGDALTEVTERMRDAAEVAGSTPGAPAHTPTEIANTLRSAWRKARTEGPAEPPEDNCNVIEVGPEAFGLTQEQFDEISARALAWKAKKDAPKDEPKPTPNGAEPAAANPATVGAATSALGDKKEQQRLERLRKVQADIEAVEEDYWTCRDYMRRIYRAAMQQMVPPHAVLAQCSGRALTLIPARIRLPGVIGGTRGGSLNWFAAVVASTGGGKSSSQDLAEELVPGWDNPVSHRHEPIERNIGSGEGIVNAFVRTPARRGQPPEFHSAILFSADEIDTLTAMGARQGATTTALLCQAFTAKTLGFSYSKTTNNYHIPAHSYRLVFMLSGQPERCGPLMSDSAVGMPQRFMWFPAFDLRIDDIPQTDPIDPLGLPAMSDWAGVTQLNIPEEARRLIREARRSSGRGEAGLMSSHEVFTRVKFAEAHAVLSGRVQMNLEDWRLSGIGEKVSKIVRRWVQEELAGIEEEEDRKLGKRMGVRTEAAKESEGQAAMRRVAEWVVRKLQSGPMTEGDLRRDAGKKADRDRLDQVLMNLSRLGVIEQDPRPGDRKDTVRWKLC